MRVNRDTQISRETRRVEEHDTAVPMFPTVDMWCKILGSSYHRRDMTFNADSMAYIDQMSYGLPGDFNEDAAW